MSLFFQTEKFRQKKKKYTKNIPRINQIKDKQTDNKRSLFSSSKIVSVSQLAFPAFLNGRLAPRCVSCADGWWHQRNACLNNVPRPGVQSQFISRLIEALKASICSPCTDVLPEALGSSNGPLGRQEAKTNQILNGHICLMIYRDWYLSWSIWSTSPCLREHIHTVINVNVTLALTKLSWVWL